MAVTVTGRAAYRIQHIVDIGPKAIANGATDEFTSNCRLREGQITNPTGGAITVTISDKQGSPIALIGPYSIAASGGLLEWDYDIGIYAAGGVTVTASASGLTGWMAVETWP